MSGSGGGGANQSRDRAGAGDSLCTVCVYVWKHFTNWCSTDLRDQFVTIVALVAARPGTERRKIDYFS